MGHNVADRSDDSYGSLLPALGRHRSAVQAAIDLAAWLTGIWLAVMLRFEFSATSWPLSKVFVAFAIAGAAQLLVGFAAGLYIGRWRFGSFDEVPAVAQTALAATGVLFVIACLGFSPRLLPISVAVASGLFAMMLMGLSRYLWRFRIDRRLRPSAEAATKVLVFGAGEAGVALVHAMLRNPSSPYYPVGMLDDDASKQQLRVTGTPVLGTRDDMLEAVERTGARHLIIAVPSAKNTLVRDVSAAALDADLAVSVLPRVDELLSPEVNIGDVRPLDERDLLGRHEIATDVEQIAGYLTGKVVLVTGAGGSIGSELCRQIHQFGPSRLVMLDRDESALHAVQLSIEGRAMLDTRNLVVADIRDRPRVDEVFAEHRPDVVFHTAALKHLPLLEMYPEEGTKTNVEGTRNLLLAAERNGVERFVNISTDKAADPTSVLGHTKRSAELLTAGVATRADGTYLSVRFGNVLGSRGSVLEAFRAQIIDGGPVTVTHRDVTRYFMLVEEAVQLVIQAGAIGNDGEALVLDMGEPVRIADVARRLVAGAERKIDIVYTGLRPGEKMHEVLLGASELDHRPAHPLISHVHVPAPRLDDVETRPLAEMLTAPASVVASNPEATGIDLSAPTPAATPEPATGGRLYLSPPDMSATERARLTEAFDSNWIAPVGPDLTAFEAGLAQACGRSHAVALTSGTAALHLGLLLAGVEPGDAVLVPSLTFVATANAVLQCGAEPCFVDSEGGSWGMDPDLVAATLARRKRLGRLPKAVMSVDLYGQCADNARLERVCATYGVPLIVDAAESLGAARDGRPAGSHGLIAAVSFNGNKVMTTGGGGALLTDDPGIARRALHLATQAKQPVAHYEHIEPGFNYRMSNLLAAIGRGQLERLPSMIAQRRRINDRYRSELSTLPGIGFMPVPQGSDPNCWLSVITVDPAKAGVLPEDLRQALEAQDIEARPAWKPMHLQPLFADSPMVGGPISDAVFATGLCLPSGSAMTDADVTRVSSVIVDMVRERTGATRPNELIELRA